MIILIISVKFVHFNARIVKFKKITVQTVKVIEDQVKILSPHLFDMLNKYLKIIFLIKEKFDDGKSDYCQDCKL